MTGGTPLAADTTDLAKFFARHPEGIGRVPDGSAPRGPHAPGYFAFRASVRVGAWQLFPLVVEPPAGGNADRS